MSKPMTKTQLVAAVADAMGADKKTAAAALDAIAAVVTNEVAAAAPSPCRASARSSAVPAPSARCATPPPARP